MENCASTEQKGNVPIESRNPSLEEKLAKLEAENVKLRERVAELEQALSHKNQHSSIQGSMELILQNFRNKKLCWNKIDQKWKEDVDFVCSCFDAFPGVACVKKYKNLELRSLHKKRKTKLKFTDLPYDLMVNERVVLAALGSSEGPTWDQVPTWLRSKPDIVAVALLYGKIQFEDVNEDLWYTHPTVALVGVNENVLDVEECLCINDKMFKDAIEKQYLALEQLPTRLIHNAEFARTFPVNATNLRVIRELLHHETALQHESSYWREVLSVFIEAKSYLIDGISFQDLFEKFIPEDLLVDFDFMITVCALVPKAFSLAHESLVDDETFVRAALNANTEVLYWMSHETQLANRNFVMNFTPDFSNTMPFLVGEVMKAIEPTFWEDKRFARKWMKFGKGYPVHVVEDETLWEVWSHDREICLLNAQYNGSLDYTSQEWLDDESFLLDVIENWERPDAYDTLYNCGVWSSRVMIAVFAASCDFAKKEMLKLHFEGEDVRIKEILSFTERLLTRFNVYSECVLGKMLSNQTVETTGTLVTMLNQGAETSSIYKKKIAEYLEVPTGKWLRDLRRADANLREAVAPWAHKYQ